ncbi:hypothetical protein J6590_064183 [Homalodisca vitripennis]|nr:hypothetical protein J6590_064183 [Homalodisca vitripennis]
MMGCRAVVGLLLLLAASQGCQTPLALHHIPGNVHIAGLFAAHSGVNCSELESEGYQHLSTAISVVQTLREVNYIPGISIGLSVYDTCSSVDLAHKAVINALVQADCLHAVSLGCISTAPTATMLAPLLGSLETPVTPLTDPNDPALLSQLTMDMLLAHDWPVVDWLLTSSPEHLSQFVREASQRHICIRHHTHLADLREIPEGLVIIVAKWADLEDSLRINPNSKLLFISLDGEVGEGEFELTVGRQRCYRLN